jgi:hypothetical protein
MTPVVGTLLVGPYYATMSLQRHLNRPGYITQHTTSQAISVRQ